MTQKSRCDDADPNRCQGITKNGQCAQLRIEGSQFCRRHARQSSAKIEEDRLRHYLLSNPMLQEKLNRQFGIEEVRSLREEIHLARVMVETRLDLIEPGDKGDMLTAFSSVNTYLQTIEKLTASAHKMEISLGSLLTKSSVFALGQDLVGILAEELQGIPDYEETIDRISERLVVAIANTQNEEKKSK
jgi:hypothetical protein